jgi:hypothetical protein
MINDRRFLALTDEEMGLYRKARSLSPAQVDREKRIYVTYGQWVTARRHREEETAPSPKFLGKDCVALVGVLLPGENLADFIQFRHRMQPVVEMRGDKFLRKKASLAELKSRKKRAHK